MHSPPGAGRVNITRRSAHSLLVVRLPAPLLYLIAGAHGPGFVVVIVVDESERVAAAAA